MPAPWIGGLRYQRQPRNPWDLRPAPARRRVTGPQDGSYEPGTGRPNLAWRRNIVPVSENCRLSSSAVGTASGGLSCVDIDQSSQHSEPAFSPGAVHSRLVTPRPALDASPRHAPGRPASAGPRRTEGGHAAAPEAGTTADEVG